MYVIKFYYTQSQQKQVSEFVQYLFKLMRGILYLETRMVMEQNSEPLQLRFPKSAKSCLKTSTDASHNFKIITMSHGH